jgi:uncharacterized protein with FMN-binding domain
MEDTTNQRKVIITFLAVAIIAVIVVAAVATSPKKMQANSTASGGSSSTATIGSKDTNFKDGTYTATGSYESPGGNESITVRVTLQQGVITATSADSGAQDPEASEYQSMFIDGYKSLVVGKDIASVNLSRVSGSSLTSQGFNDAISKIENQAKA